MAKHTKPVAQQSWSITQADIDSITKPEAVWGTTRLLPPEEEIPKEFWGTNIYTRIADAMFVGHPAPAGEIQFHPGFREDGPATFQCVMAHMKSFDPKHEHKIAGVAYMISKIMHVTAILT
jgi:hypothetical protein